jgi:hypothetical protein
MRHTGFGRKTVVKLAEEGVFRGFRHQNGARTYWKFKLSLVDAALMGTPPEKRMGGPGGNSGV